MTLLFALTGSFSSSSNEAICLSATSAHFCIWHSIIFPVGDANEVDGGCQAPNTGVKPDKVPGTSWGEIHFMETFPRDTLGATVWEVLWDSAHRQYPLKTPKWFKPGFEPGTLLPKAGVPKFRSTL
ncbi:hypothetical protein EDB84DRAFT_1443515 [Lactarius hengduanensis]|nr:hypothetical protein EDB84DRAFT_1443515 [Lactarius hengduanensis]